MARACPHLAGDTFYARSGLTSEDGRRHLDTNSSQTTFATCQALALKIHVSFGRVYVNSRLFIQYIFQGSKSGRARMDFSFLGG